MSRKASLFKRIKPEFKRRKSTRKKNTEQSGYVINAMTKTFNHDVDFLDKKTGKVRFSKLKYDKQDLFENTPIFPYPPLNFKEEKKIGWGNITRKVMSPFAEFRKIKIYNQQSPLQRKMKDRKNLPFYFTKKNNKRKKKTKQQNPKIKYNFNQALQQIISNSSLYSDNSANKRSRGNASRSSMRSRNSDRSATDGNKVSENTSQEKTSFKSRFLSGSRMSNMSIRSVHKVNVNFVRDRLNTLKINTSDPIKIAEVRARMIRFGNGPLNVFPQETSHRVSVVTPKGEIIEQNLTEEVQKDLPSVQENTSSQTDNKSPKHDKFSQKLRSIFSNRSQIKKITKANKFQIMRNITMKLSQVKPRGFKQCSCEDDVLCRSCRVRSNLHSRAESPAIPIPKSRLGRPKKIKETDLITPLRIEHSRIKQKALELLNNSSRINNTQFSRNYSTIARIQDLNHLNRTHNIQNSSKSPTPIFRTCLHPKFHEKLKF
ncbi:unnamed protein product [Moneuplotes crassus]|uniref:Uncharacterized protein n=1 Tax=Euplotes crassus TaxID=5936 RepID=A0AAD1U7L9_EUPCR|nr:unnamed protein product [Moneuplotes crassus]